MGIGPIFSISDGLADPRRTEGIRAPHFEVGASTRAGQDRPSQQHTAEHSLADENNEPDLERDEEPQESSEADRDVLRGTRVNFIA